MFVNTRTLGKEGLVVSELGPGCVGMSEFRDTTDEDLRRSEEVAPAGAAGERYNDAGMRSVDV